MFVPSALGEEYGSIIRYTFKSNDVLDGALRITIQEEATGHSVWYTERVLAEHEILEYLKDSSSQSLRWTIHRPKSGWYIRIRSPVFPPNSFVPLVPYDGAAETNASELGATLTFTCQTNIDASPPNPVRVVPLEGPGARRESLQSDHSYPPSPGSGRNLASVISPQTSPSPLPLRTESFASTLPSSSTSQISPSRKPGFTRFFLKQTGDTSTQFVTKGSGVNRLSSFLPSVVTQAFFSPRRSFTISTPEYPSVFTFTDTTPLFGAHQTTGLIAIDHGVAKVLGVEPSWWVAVGLAYVEFLEERDGYLAAANG